MSRRARFWWAAWALSGLASIAVLAWVSATALDLQHGEAEARAQTAAERRAHDAVWQMDSWMALVLATEAGRPWYEYSPYHEAQGSSYTTLLNEIPKGAILFKSPLLTFESPLLRLHFQLDPVGDARSPQVPVGNLRDLAQATGLTAEVMQDRDERLAALAPLLDRAALLPRVAVAEEPVPGGEPAGEGRYADRAQEQQVAADLEWRARAESVKRAQQKSEGSGKRPSGSNLVEADEDPETLIGPLVPLWLGSEEVPVLVYVRRVLRGEEVLLQGFHVDWEQLQDTLLERGGAAVTGLVPWRGERTDSLRLVTVPARVRAAPPAGLEAETGWTQLVLAVSWLVVVAALAASGAALYRSVRWADSRSRFASAVTHELRTPLTTFRLYTDLLRGASDAADREVYLETLDRESTRLARLVENVLDYARLEEGRRPQAARAHDLEELLERMEPSLAARCGEAGAAWNLSCEFATGLRVHAEEDGLGRILSNLVDNACKYGDSLVELAVRADDQAVEFEVCDDGPGLAPGQDEAVFRLFDRAGRDSADASPGIGLGLALARGLAAEWGGTLDYALRPGRGACFVLRLPRG